MNRDRLITTGTVLMALAAVLVIAGCQGASRAGTPYTQTVGRQLRAYVPVDIETAHTTAIRVLEDDFKYVIAEEALDARESVIKARTAKGRAVEVQGLFMEEDRTRLEIYVGPFGNLWLEADILDTIEDRLGITADQVDEVDQTEAARDRPGVALAPASS